MVFGRGGKKVKIKAKKTEVCVEVEPHMDGVLAVNSLINWSDYDNLVGQVLQAKFGTLLERKMAEFEETKMKLKQCMERNYFGGQSANSRALGSNELIRKLNTPIAARTAHNQPQILTAKMIEDPKTPMTSRMMQILKTPRELFTAKSSKTQQVQSTPRISQVYPTPLSSKTRNDVPDTSKQLSTAKPIEHSLKRLAIAKAMQKEFAEEHLLIAQPLNFDLVKTPAAKDQAQSTAKSAQKLKELVEREKKAQKQREEFLKDKAEHAKREREERFKRVHQKNLIKEAERQDNLQKWQEKQVALKNFAEEQKRQQAQTPKCEKTPKKPVVRAMAVEMQLKTIQNENNDHRDRIAKADRQYKTPLAENSQNIQSKAQGGNGGAGGKAPNIQMDQHLKMNDYPFRESSVLLIHNQEDEQQQMDIDGSADGNALNMQMDQHREENDLQLLEDIVPPTQEDEQQLQMDTADVVDESDESSMYDMTKEKIPIPATEENYNVDDLSSHDETDCADSPRKQIPKWAQIENLQKHITCIRATGLTMDNIERHFGRIQQPTLQELFSDKRKKYAKRRLSSAMWDSPMSDPTPGVGHYPNLIPQPTSSHSGH